MGELVDWQTMTGQHPLTNVGIDCFGPFLTKRSRSMEQSYGCILKCMATKAVHIEMLNTLETDSFINEFMRFAASQGKPKQIRCHNGTNFTGAFNKTQKKLDH